ncbi:MAG: type II toxin-antitoxin system VapC family toxin [Chloroflexota bacterium]
MPERWLLDTDVAIEYLRDRQEAIDYLESREGSLLISALTVAELYAGVRGEREQHHLEQFLDAFEVLPVSQEVGRIGGLFRRNYGSTHGTGLVDALIGATAQLYRATLVTFNARHYPMLNNVQVPYARL